MSDKFKNLLHNNKFLFIIPNLISGYKLLYFYNMNFVNGEVLFYEVIILMLILLGINSLIYLFLKKALKDTHKVFCILCFITIFYFTKLNLVAFLGFVAFVLMLVFNFKKFIHFNLEYIVSICSFIIIFLFGYNFLIGIYNVNYITFKSKEYNYHMDIKVDEDTESPNIYWVHCDGMISLDTAKEYFSYRNKDLANYFEKNQYAVNEDASIIAGHSTTRYLNAMFNPYYYDNFFKDYLYDLEESFLDPKHNMDFIVDFYELEEKRLNNEVLKAFKEKGYTTIQIADYNQYVTLGTDYFYDYFVFDSRSRHILEKKELRYIEPTNSDFKLRSYIQFNHSRTLLNTTFLYPLFEDINYLDYQVLDYNDLNISDYIYMDHSRYWVGKAILKSIDHSSEINDSKFVFIDYKLNHLALTFDFFGNILEESNMYNLEYYLGNYTYASKLLIDLLDFIHDKDEDAIIIVQGDHGIHMLDTDEMMKQLSITKEEVQDIRNSVISAYYIPEKYQNGDEEHLDNPLNISRYLVNNFVGQNYEYIK